MSYFKKHASLRGVTISKSTLEVKELLKKAQSIKEPSTTIDTIIPMKNECQRASRSERSVKVHFHEGATSW